MEQLPTVESFSLEEPSVRIFGVETEFDVRFKSGQINDSWRHHLTPPMLRHYLELESYLRYNGDIPKLYLQNGDLIYPDVGHLELASRECFGPREAVIATRSGIHLLAHLPLLTQNGGQIFRRGATVSPINNNITTKGYHVNLCIPDSVATVEQLSPLETHFATQIYAWGGIVTKGCFQIGAKSHDIGYGMSETVSRPTTVGGKQLAVIRSAVGATDKDTNSPEHGLGRLEDRSKTPSSPWSDFMAMATTSVLLRIIEHPDLLQAENAALKGLRLRNSIQTFKSVSQDMAMQNIYELENGQQLSALDIQKKLATLAISACEKLVLPEDEVYAVQEWVRILDDMSKFQQGTADISLIADRVGWAGKYKRLVLRLGEAAVHEGTSDALRYCLNWDRIAPTGAGQLYDKKYGLQLFSEEEVEYFLKHPSAHTRSKIRGDYIANAETRDTINYLDWTSLWIKESDGDIRRVRLHPYQTELKLPED